MVREFQCDTLGRNTAEIWYNTAADAEMDVNRQNTLSFAHDALGRSTAAADPAASYDYQYDALGRRTSVTHDITGLGFPVVLASAYDAASNRTSLSATIDTTADFVNQYTYDALHRMTRIEQSGQSGGNAVAEKRIDLTYDAASQLTAAADPAASYEYQYDALGRRTSVTHGIAGLGFPVVLASAYAAASNRTSLSATIDTTADFVNQYTYDALHRMTRIEQSGVTGGNAVAEKRIDLSYEGPPKPADARHRQGQ